MSITLITIPTSLSGPERILPAHYCLKPRSPLVNWHLPARSDWLETLAMSSWDNSIRSLEVEIDRFTSRISLVVAPSISYPPPFPPPPLSVSWFFCLCIRELIAGFSLPPFYFCLVWFFSVSYLCLVLLFCFLLTDFGCLHHAGSSRNGPRSQHQSGCVGEGVERGQNAGDCWR